MPADRPLDVVVRLRPFLASIGVPLLPLRIRERHHYLLNQQDDCGRVALTIGYLLRSASGQNSTVATSAALPRSTRPGAKWKQSLAKTSSEVPSS